MKVNVRKIPVVFATDENAINFLHIMTRCVLFAFRTHIRKLSHSPVYSFSFWFFFFCQIMFKVYLFFICNCQGTHYFEYCYVFCSQIRDLIIFSRHILSLIFSGVLHYYFFLFFRYVLRACSVVVFHWPCCCECDLIFSKLIISTYRNFFMTDIQVFIAHVILILSWLRDNIYWLEWE